MISFKTRFLAAGVILLFFISLLFGDTSPTRRLRSWIAFPSIFILRVSTFFLNDFLSLSQTKNLIAENRFLKREVSLLKKDLSLLEEKTRALERQENLLAFQASHPETGGLFCPVIGRDPSHWSQTILLGRGRQEGVQVDMAVIGTKGLVGRIVEVEENWSKALLLTDASSKVGAILERNREAGLLTGASDGGLLTLEYLSAGADIREGDKVLTAGFGEIFPKGIIIGEVVGFGRRKEDLFMYAKVQPAEHLSQLEEVLCVRK